MSRYATVVPGVVGCGTYALVTRMADAALADAHPVTATAASSSAHAIPSTDVSLRMGSGYRVSPLHGGAEQAERGEPRSRPPQRTPRTPEPARRHTGRHA